MDGRDLLGLAASGGAVMYPLLLCSVVSLAVILERTWTLVRAQRGAARLRGMVLETGEADASRASGDALAEATALSRRDTSPLGPVFKAVLSARSAGADALERIAARRLAEAARGLKRYVWLLGTVGSLAPFIGLLGTVLGIIRAFESMAATGSGGFAVVAAGISEALVATAAGLLVGVLSIFAYNALTVRIANLTAVWREWTEELLIELAAPSAAQGATAPPAAAPAWEGAYARVAQSR